MVGYLQNVYVLIYIFLINAKLINNIYYLVFTGGIENDPQIFSFENLQSLFIGISISMHSIAHIFHEFFI